MLFRLIYGGAAGYRPPVQKVTNYSSTSLSYFRFTIPWTLK